jgi:hypothetical protein
MQPRSTLRAVQAPLVSRAFLARSCMPGGHTPTREEQTSPRRYESAYLRPAKRMRHSSTHARRTNANAILVLVTLRNAFVAQQTAAAAAALH